tara:strand:+ start:3254 stop:4117 length:864 start_codon:yes stop_codon:yes gene_type:complete
MNDNDNDSIFIFEFWDLLLHFKYFILGTIALTTIAGVLYALTATPLYRAQVLMIEAENQGSSQGLSSIASQIGGMTGLDIGGSNNNSDSYVEILKSRTFLEDFINSTDSKKLIFSSSWNNEENDWFTEEPSDFKSYYTFKEDILSVSKNVKTGVFTLSVVWHEPKQAEVWANLLVKNLNSLLQKRAIEEAEKRLFYLERQTSQTNIQGMQIMIGALMQSEYEKAMIANVKEDFGFTIIDPAKVPEVKFSPNRTLITILSFISGIFLGILLVIVINTIMNYQRYKNAS